MRKKEYHKSIYPISFKADKELVELIQENLEKLNKESNIKVSKSDLIVISLKRILMELKAGKLQTSTFLYNK